MSDRRRFRFPLVYFAILTAITGAEARAQYVTLSLKAVKVNGVPITPTNDVTVAPGDIVTAEIRISGWAPEKLVGYGTSLEFSSFTSSGCGSLFPLGVDDPHPQLECPNGDIDCPEGLTCWTPRVTKPTGVLRRPQPRSRTRLFL